MEQKPFSHSYVLRMTYKHMRKCVEVSISKTIERIGEFANDSEKSKEIFKTLADLHSIRRQLDDFQS